MIDGRNTLATIVQSSAVELFQAFSIAIAPVTDSKGLPAGLELQLSSASTFSSAALSGSLALFIPYDIYALVKHPPQRPFEPKDWTRELCNQLLGRIKNRLHSCEIDLITGLPMSVTGTLLERHRSGKLPDVIFAFRTLRGQVTVTLTGSFDYTRIVYTGKRFSAKEGDVILF